MPARHATLQPAIGAEKTVWINRRVSWRFGARARRNLRQLGLVGMLLLSSGAYGAADWPDTCIATVMDYAVWRDQTDAAAVASLFVESGVFIMGSDAFKGQAAIKARVQAAQDGPIYRHLMTTVQVKANSEQTASGISYAMVYSAPKGPMPTSEFSLRAIGAYHDQFQRVGETCKIVRREFIPAFASNHLPSNHKESL